MLSLRIQTNFEVPKLIQAESKSTINDVLDKISTYISDARLILMRERRILGPLMTLEDYGIVDNDVLHYTAHMGGPLLSHHETRFGMEGNYFDSRTNVREYGDDIATKIATLYPIATVVAMRENSTLFWEFMVHSGGYSIDKTTIEANVSLLSWSKQLNTWNEVHEPVSSSLELAENNTDQSWHRLKYNPSIWEANRLYAFCVNSHIETEFYKNFSKIFYNILQDDLHLPRVIATLIYEYDQRSFQNHTHTSRGMMLINSLGKTAGSLSGYYCGYFTLSE